MAKEPMIPLAVVGVGAIFPGSLEKGGFWRNIITGADLITDVPPTHWLPEDYFDPDPKIQDKTYAKRGGFLPNVPFNPMEHAIAPANMTATDTSQLLALVVAQQVLEDAAQGQFSRLNRERTSVILAMVNNNTLLWEMASRLQRPVWVKALRESGIPENEVEQICERILSHYVPWQENSFPGMLLNVTAGRIANRFDLGGTNCVVDAACAGSLASVHLAALELAQGHSDLAIVGGVDTGGDILSYLCFSKTPALSPTGDCRPFSDQADGTLLGEGIAMVALRRLEDAERDGDRIYAVLRGIGSSSDGRDKSIYAPRAKGQGQAIRRAYAAAGYGINSVELVEAHGTGTKVGDVVELEAYGAVFDGTARPDRQWCALGSIKSQIGHTKATAGVAGLIKAVMALHHKVLPPTIKIERPNPKLNLEQSPFYLNTVSRPWIRGADHPRRASVNATGFGGTNFHVTLEEYTGSGNKAWRIRTAPSELVVLTAQNAEELVKQCRALAVEAKDDRALERLARCSQSEVDAQLPTRLAVIADSPADLQKKLGRAADRIQSQREAAFSEPDGIYFAVGAEPGEVGVLFPGQGSQYVGMGADLSMAFDEARAVWDRTSDELRLNEVVFPRPAFTDAERSRQEEHLRSTEWAQPGIGITSLAAWRVLQAVNLPVDRLAGHSFGELTALCVSGALGEQELLRLARRRGELMAASPAEPGAMTAVFCPADDLGARLAEWGIDLSIANRNAPDQTVLSGSVRAVAEAERRLTDAGINFQRLPVATAFHSPLMEQAVAPFRAYLDELAVAEPLVPVYSNVDAGVYPASAEEVRERLAAQLVSPVLFTDQITAMYEAGVRTFVEVGPGSVLTGLVGRILGASPHLAVSVDRKGRHGLTSLWHLLGQLIVNGVPLNLAALWEAYAPVPEPKPEEQKGMTVMINGANYGRPYPPVGGAAALPRPNPPAEVGQAGRASAAQAAPALAEPVADVVSQANVTPVVDVTPVSDDLQARVIGAHTAFQQAMAENHALFLRTIEQALMGATAPVPQPAAQAPVTPTAAPLAQAVLQAAPIALPSAPAPVTPPAAPALNSTAVLLEAVAEKTGYPAEMLELGMELEAGLGIDSIKRVEILAALQERIPGLPPIEPGQMASLRTLGQIAAYVEAAMGAGATTVPAAEPSPALNVGAVLLEAVAEKTGYPVEMLELDMELESGLGVDSIKRVEILAAMQERLPNLPAIDLSQMASLRTLGQIAAHFQGAGPTAPAAAPAAESDGAAVPAKCQILRWALETVAAPARGFTMPGLIGGKGLIAVTEDGLGIAPLVVESLAARGLDARLVSEVPADAAGVIFLGGLREVTSIADASSVNREAFHAARTVAPRFTQGAGLFVTVQATGGDFGLSGEAGLRAWTAGLSGLVKSAGKEWPKTAVKAIDLQWRSTPDEMAGAILDELFAGGPEIEVGLRADGTRLTLINRPGQITRQDGERIGPSDVLLVSGGARGVVAASLIALAKDCRPKLVLLGRTALIDEPAACRGADTEPDLKRLLHAQAREEGRRLTPQELSQQVQRILFSREVRANIAAMEAAGSPVRYIAVDVQDTVAIKSALGHVRQEWGPVTGLIHGAGVLDDRFIKDKTDEQFSRVFDTKVVGMKSLLEATADDPLRVIAIFSTLAARVGNPGQSDYAIANEVLNRVAAVEARRRGPDCLVKSMCWGAWDGGGMVPPSLKGFFAAHDVALIPLEAGAALFVAELQDGPAAELDLLLAAAPTGAGAFVEGDINEAMTALTHAYIYPATERTAEMDVHVQAESQPYLIDHTVEAVPVLPAMQALEWFVRAGTAFRPDLEVAACRDLKVVSGVRLTRFYAGGHKLTVRLTASLAEARGAHVKASLIGENGTVHYTGLLEFRRKGASLPQPEVTPPAAPAQAWPWEPADCYSDRMLFHGPGFQVIDRLDSLAGDGGTARVNGIRAMNWGGECWQADVAAMDGGLQAAGLWGAHTCKRMSLPTRVGCYRHYDAGLAEGPFRCIFRCRVVGSYRTVSDILLVTAQGKPVAEMRDVELCFVGNPIPMNEGVRAK